MYCNQQFSLINNTIIQNIIVCDNYEMANVIARASYGNDAFAVDTTYYPVIIGDTYHIEDNKFYRYDEESEVYNEIKKNPTESEEIMILKSEINELKKQHDDNLLLLGDAYYELSLVELGLL